MENPICAKDAPDIANRNTESSNERIAIFRMIFPFAPILLRLPVLAPSAAGCED
jgi:hypothetical protein